MSMRRMLVWVGLGIASVGCGQSGGPSDPGTGEPPGATFDLRNVPYTLNADYIIAGDIVTDDTWSGVIALTDKATIMPGVTINVDPDSTFYGFPGATLVVRGALNVGGNAAAPVSMAPWSPGERWGGILVQQGTVDITGANLSDVTAALVCEAGATSCDMSFVSIQNVQYAIQFSSMGTISYATIEHMANGGMSVLAGANVTVTDSIIRSSTADIFVISGGDVAIDHSDIGGAEYEHCGLHFNDVGAFSITNSNIAENVYGFMLKNAVDPIITNNNFVANSTTHMADYGGNVNVNATMNYWDGGPPNITDMEFDFGSPAGSAYTGAGPRPTPAPAAL